MTSRSLPISFTGDEYASPPPAELTQPTDEQLMECLQRGQSDSLSWLFRRYFRLVLGVSLNILRDAGEAEDLMQEVFFEIYRKPHLFDPKKGSVRTWILQYAYHRSFDRRQYLKVRKFYNSHLDASDLGHLEPYYSPSGWDGLTCEERNQMLRKAMGALTEKQKQVFQLAYFNGLLMNEIAEHMGESYERTRGFYYRGLNKLREVLHGPLSEQRQEACKAAGAAD